MIYKAIKNYSFHHHTFHLVRVNAKFRYVASFRRNSGIFVGLLKLTFLVFVGFIKLIFVGHLLSLRDKLYRTRTFQVDGILLIYIACEKKYFQSSKDLICKWFERSDPLHDLPNQLQTFY